MVWPEPRPSGSGYSEIDRSLTLAARKEVEKPLEANPPSLEHDSTETVLPVGTRTLRMTLAYEGTNYCGWQVQPNGTAIQAVVEQALAEFTGEETRVVASGRTDAGVHAVGQVASFTTHSTAPCHGFLHGLPRYLPEDIVVCDVQEVAAGFNARYDARRKWYRYVIHNSRIRVPFLRNGVLWQRSPLDDIAMHAAVQCLVGTHDFRCFETQWPNRSSSIRTIFHASMKRSTSWNVWDSSDLQSTLPNATAADGSMTFASESSGLNPDFLCFDIEADGFLYNMVRAIVGTLIHVGRGRWTPADMERILKSGDRTHAGETAPAQGLYLMRVEY
jgi:tRNA pseudouridine38-40 synthase